MNSYLVYFLLHGRNRPEAMDIGELINKKYITIYLKYTKWELKKLE